jgi:hypothetical protein
MSPLQKRHGLYVGPDIACIMTLVTENLESISVTHIKLDAPGLSRATGLCYDGKTCQCLGIPYAVVPSRFRRPKPAPAPWHDRALDATKFGYELLSLHFM